jgi:hypothetical protein
MRTRRRDRLRAVTIMFAIGFVSFHFLSRTAQFTSFMQNIGSACNTLLDAKIAITLKTSAQESLSKLPIYLSTLLSCFTGHDILIASDMEQEIGQYRLHDILKELPESLRAGNHDFDVYYALQAHKSSGQELAMFQIDTNLRPMPDGGLTNANSHPC